jgi:hypothetical protein
VGLGVGMAGFSVCLVDARLMEGLCVTQWVVVVDAAWHVQS